MASRDLRMVAALADEGVPLPPMVVNVLHEHKMKSKGEFVFPTDQCKPQHHANILHRGFEPAQVAAGVVDESKTSGRHSTSSVAKALARSPSASVQRSSI
jgi:hypothetical protein